MRVKNIKRKYTASFSQNRSSFQDNLHVIMTRTLDRRDIHERSKTKQVMQPMAVIECARAFSLKDLYYQ